CICIPVATLLFPLFRAIIEISAHTSVPYILWFLRYSLYPSSGIFESGRSFVFVFMMSPYLISACRGKTKAILPYQLIGFSVLSDDKLTFSMITCVDFAVI